MYLIRNKNNGEVLFMDPFFTDKEIDPKLLLPDYDKASMETGWSEDTQLPMHYKLEKNGNIHELSLEEQVKEGIITLLPSQKIENGEIVLKTLEERYKAGLIEVDEPFQYIDAVKNSIENRSLEEVINNKLLKTVKDCDRAEEKVNEAIAKAMDEGYTPSDEIKLMKNYLYWIDETYYTDKVGAQHKQEIISIAEQHQKNIEDQEKLRANTTSLEERLKTANSQIAQAEAPDAPEKVTKTQLNELRKQKDKLENELNQARETQANLVHDDKALEQKKNLSEAALAELAKTARAEKEKARNEFVEMKSFTDQVKEKYKSYKDQIEKIRARL